MLFNGCIIAMVWCLICKLKISISEIGENNFKNTILYRVYYLISLEIHVLGQAMPSLQIIAISKFYLVYIVVEHIIDVILK